MIWSYRRLHLLHLTFDGSSWRLDLSNPTEWRIDRIQGLVSRAEVIWMILWNPEILRIVMTDFNYVRLLHTNTKMKRAYTQDDIRIWDWVGCFPSYNLTLLKRHHVLCISNLSGQLHFMSFQRRTPYPQFGIRRIDDLKSRLTWLRTQYQHDWSFMKLRH